MPLLPPEDEPPLEELLEVEPELDPLDEEPLDVEPELEPPLDELLDEPQSLTWVQASCQCAPVPGA
ncbi:hypothetical protein R50072_29870 [Simiduia litorea]